MSHNREGPSRGSFHTVQPLRDLESNWAVDLAKNLEEYLHNICSGETTGEDSSSPFSINFAEAALLLQGSIQVYSRKVEYLYSLVLHAWELISQDRQNVELQSGSAREEGNSSQTVHDEDEHDNFWDLNNIPVDENNSVGIPKERKDFSDHFLKPPANLVVLEGKDTVGDGGELETYLLSTSNLYCDFIILEPCDSATVDDYLEDCKAGRNRNGSSRGTSLSRSRKSTTSLGSQSGRSRRSTGNIKDVNLGPAPEIDKCGQNDSSFRHEWHDPFASGGNLQDFGMCDGHAETREFVARDFDVSDDDPWKSLNPHEPFS